MVKLLKQMMLFLSRQPIVQYISKRINNGNYIILMYHGVVKDGTCDGDGLQINESVFRQQMEHLKQNYDVVSLKDAMEDNTIKAKKGPNIVITFDDGYANNYTHAYPILKELGLPATIFLVTNRVDTNKLFWYDKLFSSTPKNVPLDQIFETIKSFKEFHPHKVDYKVDQYLEKKQYKIPPHAHECYGILSWNQIHKMANSGLITFGSHTHDHELLTNMSDDEVKETLQTSYDIMQTVPGSVDVFCYPNGFYTDVHTQMCEEVGYKLGVVTDIGIWKHKKKDYRIPRWYIGCSENIECFSPIVSGTTGTIQTIKQNVRI